MTAGNSSQISDGASAVILASRRKPREVGLRPRAHLRTTVVVGSDPDLMLSGPIAATRRALSRTGLCLEDLDVIEINEAFPSVVLAWQPDIDPVMAKVNPTAAPSRWVILLVHQVRAW